MKNIELNDIKTLDFDYLIIDFPNLVSIEKSFCLCVKNENIFAKNAKR